MEGHRGSLEITDIVELVARTAYRPNIRWISSRWGQRNNAPADCATMLVGGWLQDAWGNLNPHHVSAYNIPTPFIPEHTVYDPETGRIKARGWRSIVAEMVIERIIRPDVHVERLLGTKETEDARRAAGTMA